MSGTAVGGWVPVVGAAYRHSRIDKWVHVVIWPTCQCKNGSVWVHLGSMASRSETDGDRLGCPRVGPGPLDPRVSEQTGSLLFLWAIH